MSAKEKAKELVDKYYYSMNPNAPDCNISYNQAKQCAIIAVDELINAFIELSRQESGTTHIDFGHGYWQDVKSEIEKL